jgi:DNA-binding PadR family transcriptional regulator
MTGVPRWSRSNPLALAVLVCLYEKPMHPYEVAQTLRARAKQESVRLNYGSLYAVVESLEKNSFIKATGTVQEGKRPQRTVYAITDAGATEMTDWLTELIGTPAKEYPAFMAGLSFLPALDPDDALAALQRRREGLVVKLAALRGVEQAARDAGLPRIFGLEAEYEEGQLAAELKFVTALADEMAAGTLEGLDMWRLFQSDEFDPEEVHFSFELPKE